MTSPTFRGACSICLFFSLTAAPLRAAIHGAENPKAYTAHQYHRDLLDFNRRTLTDQYQQVGNHDPKWDAQAAAFLNGMAIRFSNVGVAHRDRLPDEPSFEDLDKQAKALRDLGCDDPLILDMCSVMMLDSGQRKEYRALARKAFDALLTSRYSVGRATNSARRALRDTNPTDEKDQYARFDDNLYNGDLATIGSGDLPGNDRRFVFYTMRDELDRWPVEELGRFYEAAKSGDPWLADMVGGKYHIRAAWQARGGGWANTVTPQGWKVFEEEIQKAHKCLEDAWNLATNFPEPAEQMITVAMAESDKQGLRTWFDRATEAQLDYMPAYHTYLYAIYPRWLGSYPEMYLFGLECANTKRFDTLVPYFYIDALRTIGNDMGGDWAYWRRPGTFEKAAEVLDGYGEHDAAIGDRPWFESQIVGFAWQLQRYKEGRAALDKLNGKVDISSMNFAACMPDRTVSGIYAFTGSDGDALQQAEAAVAAGKIDEGIAAYTKIGAKIAPDDRAAHWIHNRPQELSWKKSFDAGEWIDFTAAKDLTGLESIAGKFARDGNAIVGTSDRQGAMLMCATKFGNRWEMQAKIEILPPADGKEIAPHSDAGLIFGWIGGSTCYGVFPAPQSHELAWWEGTGAPWIGRAPIEGNPTIKLKLVDGQLNVAFDSTDYIKNRATVSWASSPSACVGIGTLAGPTSKRFRITDWKIHKLDSPSPADAKEN